MKIESISLENFRCFGPGRTKIDFESGITAFVGGNGSGKTAVFQAVSRLFGVTTGQRTVRRRDFHLPPNQQELQSGASLSIEAVFSFPELEGLDEEEIEDAVPEFFLQMRASAPGAPLKARMKLQAVWTDDEPQTEVWMKTSDGSRLLKVILNGMSAKGYRL
jgi:putative ATP-dependent endonuclease of the OLD family